MVTYGRRRDGLSVMGLSGSVGHGDLNMRMSLLTNPWLGLSKFWVSTSVVGVILILAIRVLFPLHRGVVVRAMMWFIHGVFPGLPGLFDMAAIIVDEILMQICGPRRIWEPGITSEPFVVKIANDFYGVRCIIGWDYSGTKSNFFMHIMTPIRTNWYRIVGFSKLIPGATGFFSVMWSFKQRMPIRHTYHSRVRWFMKKEHNMFGNMIASKAYRKEASSNSFFIFVIFNIWHIILLM